MKKFIVTTLLLLSACMSICGITAYADSIDSQIFSPASYLEYCELSSPISVLYRDDMYVICEESRIIIYKDGNFTYKKLDGYTITSIEFFDDGLMFLSQSQLYTMSFDGEPKKADMTVVDSFAVINNTIITNPAGALYYYTATKGEDGYLFERTAFYRLTQSLYNIAVNTDNSILGIQNNCLYHFSVTNNQQSLKYLCGGIQDVKDSLIYNNYYYYTSSTGIYRVDITQSEPTKELVVEAKKQNDLSSLCDPYGIYIDSDYLYVADKTLNAISQIDLIDNTFTGLYITANQNSDLRITTNAKSLTATDQNLYLLDNNKIKCFDDAKTVYDITYYPQVLDYGVIEQGNNKYFLFTDGSTLSLQKVVKNKLTTIDFTGEIKSTAEIKRITSSNTTFYIACKDNYYTPFNVTIIYALNLATKELNCLGSIKDMSCYDITCDIFDTLYLSMTNDSGEYLVCSIDSNNQSPTTPSTTLVPNTIYTSTEKIVSVATDFTSNLYILNETNQILRLSDNKIFDITLNENLPLDKKAQELAISPTTNKVYTLFEGFILSINGEDLGVETPNKLAIPQDFNYNYTDTIYTLNVKNNSKLFLINLPNSEDTTFDYIGYQSENTTNTYVMLFSNEKYTIITNGNISAIVRTNDIENKQQVVMTQFEKQKYTIVETHLYNLPIIKKEFRSESLSQNQLVDVIKSFTINDKDYYLISYNSHYGYIDSRMLKDEIIEGKTTQYYFTVTVDINGGAIYSDKALTTKLVDIEGSINLVSLSLQNGVYEVMYNDEIAYISSSQIKDTSYYVGRNIIIISLLILSLVITVLFIIKRKVIDK